MSCSCCASLKCFESCYNQFEVMKQSKQILKEADDILYQIQNHKITNYSLLNEQIASKSYGNSKQKFNYFIQLIIDFVMFKLKDSKSINDKSDLPKFDKESIIQILSILRFESIDSNFFYHYIFKIESQNNLIKEEKINYLLNIFNLNRIECILSIPAFSFVHSNYLSNCEFVNFFKSVVSSSITNDFTSLFQLIYRYLEDQNEGELTQSQYVDFMKRNFSKEIFQINQKTNIEYFTNTIQNIIQFILLPSSKIRKIDTQTPLILDEFIKIFEISCKFISLSISRDFFDISYKRIDLYFSGKISNRNACDILDELSIIYSKLNKENIMMKINQTEISYYDFLSIVEEEIDLSNLL